MDYLSLERDNNFEVLPATHEKCRNRLPVGILTTTGEVMHDVKFRNLSRDDIKKIRDKTYAKNHPMSWMGRVVSIVLESIEDRPVYSLFRHSKFRKIPEIVLELPLQDIYYIMIMGHITEFGDLITDVKTDCPHCKHKQVFDIDLSDLKVEYSEENNHTIDVDLPIGVKIETNEDSYFYKRLIFRAPTLKDAIRNEKYYRVNNTGSFTDRVYANAIISAEDGQGTTFDEAQLKLYGSAYLTNLRAKDSAHVEHCLSNIPALLTYVLHICDNCSEDIPVFVQNSFLFPSRQKS